MSRARKGAGPWAVSGCARCAAVPGGCLRCLTGYRTLSAHAESLNALERDNSQRIQTDLLFACVLCFFAAPATFFALVDTMAALLARNRLPFASRAAAIRPAASRVRMVVRAQQTEEKPSLVNLAAPAVTVAVSNLLMAMPAAAESGKLFVSRAAHCFLSAIASVANEQAY